MLRGIDVATMDLERALNVAYALWVEDFGVFAEPAKVREALDSHLAGVDTEIRVAREPETWGTDANARASQDAFMALGGRRDR